MKIHRVSPGRYEATQDGKKVIILRIDELKKRYGQWVAYSEWDRDLVTDPELTYSDAKAAAAQMLSDQLG